MNIEFLTELLTTLVADNPLDTQVVFKMSIQTAPLSELLGTPLALEGLLASVVAHVLEEVLDALQYFAASFAIMLVLALKHPHGLTFVELWHNYKHREVLAS